MSISHAQLKAFHAVATHGGFSRAAEKLFLTQPAVSDQVRKLEEHFGVVLFHRNKRQVRLSELGERLLAITQRLFSAEAQAEELLASYRALQRGTLVLSVDATAHILPYLARFSEAYPGIRLKIVTGNSSQSLQRLLDYQVDIAIVAVLREDERLDFLPLSDDPIVAFVAASHPWAERESVTLAELSELPLILREEGSATRRILEEEMRRAGLAFHQMIEVDGREAAYEVVAAGIGVGIVSKAEFGSDARIRAIPIRDCSQRMQEYMVTLREQASRRIIQTFVEMVSTSPHRPSRAA
ncbi:LysR family transcriptional regulator [Verticiella sediminum]|uniref:LysR family transcriptional regulator n=1 Tax=Verticiella sediminum TaxID=1247510 RepID=A0A556B1A1_9BURK|nr:LysR substrate-binding domain-containing protein [Verticiella sediminum]TSH98949.1 LysR family transcriptional regulator [Verticiella sediminum]